MRRSSSRIIIDSDSNRNNSDSSDQNSNDCDCESTVLLADDNPFNLIPLRVILEDNYKIKCD